MVGLNLDPQGRLIEFSAVPPQVEETPVPPRPADWTALLTAAGLDMTRFAPAEPHWIPLVSLRRSGGVDRLVRACAGGANTNRGRILAWKAGEFPGDWPVVETRKDAAQSVAERG